MLPPRQIATGRNRDEDTRMQPLVSCPAAALARVQIVLTDIDDTLTSEGRLSALAYAALERLRAAGLLIVPVTGRPAGWCDLIARLWPVDAVVGENGAFYFRHDRADGMIRAYAKPQAERGRDRARLAELGASILAQVPGARIAADQAYRESDLAIDFAEDGPVLGDAKIDSILTCFAEAGATAKVSSIHVNGWFGAYNKLGMTRRLLADAFGLDAHRDNSRILFVGDAPNDAPMFGFFEQSVAVANFRHFATRSESLPAWITERSGGEGFAELANALLGARGPR